MLMSRQSDNCREEGEKFNIWQARLNLEMQYGDPPEEAVMKLFQRALSYTDQKKLYMALITLLERANQVSLSTSLPSLESNENLPSGEPVKPELL